MIKSIYLIGSMKNPEVPKVANRIEKELGIEAFCDWYSPGEQADIKWREYEKFRGRSFKESFHGHHAEHVFRFDKEHLDRCDGVLLVMPAGKSAHLELGYVVGTGKPGWILYDEEPDKWDIMTKFAKDIYMSTDEAIEGLRKYIEQETASEYIELEGSIILPGAIGEYRDGKAYTRVNKKMWESLTEYGQKRATLS